MESNFFDDLLKTLPGISNKHLRTDDLYHLLSTISRDQVTKCFSDGALCESHMGGFGTVKLPYVSFGTIDSTNLLDMDELIIFSYYQFSKYKYRNVADIGANIGMHSILLGRMGFNVRSFEPDERHFQLLKSNLELNQIKNIEVNRCAISDYDGEADFIRVNGNTTGSHIKGAKENPYGSLEHFKIKVKSIKKIMAWADLIKIDAEGEEAKILLSTEAKEWDNVDALVEVGSPNNAEKIYNHFKQMDVNLFSQKNGWNKVNSIDALPISYKEGTLFISKSNKMWES